MHKTEYCGVNKHNVHGSVIIRIKTKSVLPVPDCRNLPSAVPIGFLLKIRK